MSSLLHPDNDQSINPSGNESIRDVLAAYSGRREFLKGTLGAAAVMTLGGFAGESEAAYSTPSTSPKITFTGVPANLAASFTDKVSVPAGYTATVLVSWGDAIGVRGATNTHWDAAGAMTESLQKTTWGAHNDGMHFFPFTMGGVVMSHSCGLLVANHEYTDPGLVHSTTTYATDAMTQERVDVQLAAHGVSVVELRPKGRGRSKQMQVVRPSHFARRITGKTPCHISGPAAGHPLMQTAADPTGRRVLGTLNNCAHGYTPWGTYLTCEENFNGYFGAPAASLTAAPLTNLERRYGLSGSGFGYRWHEVDPRFDIRATPNEAHRFGWVVEIDPFDPQSTPIKRTALGRFKHESAGHVVGKDNSVALYMGDDERNEYIYKFVCANKYRPFHPKANRDLLDSGTLYVAKFNADGTGQWLPLVFGQNGLTPENGFNSQAEVLINTRAAADRVGATMMDRPEWVAVHPKTREVYVTLTNNNRRGTTPASSNAVNGTTTAASARPPVDAVNPRPDNRYGHILRWKEANDDVRATSFQWDIFVECGDKLAATANLKGNIIGDDLGAPDGLWFDKDGRLWIQTDQQGDGLGDWANIGGNTMSCADPATRKITRFMTSPKNCEVTGVVTTPDGKTMFVGIQHPGEDWSGSFTARSTWPDSGANGPTTQATVNKPRSSVVMITKDDGGVIGT